MPQTLDRAKAIVKKAEEYGISTWDDPKAVTDDLILARAEDIIGNLLEHSKNNSVNLALLELLHVAQVAPLSEATRQAYVERFGEEPAQSSNGDAPLAPEPAQPPAEEPPAQKDSIDDIFGTAYDDLKVAQIKNAVLVSAASGELSPEEWERVKAYEASHEERKSILGLQPEFKAPEPEPVPQSLAEAAALTPQEEAAADALAAAAGVDRSPAQGAQAGPFTSAAPAVHAAIEQHDEQEVAALYAGEVQTLAQQERLPIPPAANADQPPVLPIDITNVSDQELSRIATAFHSLFARAQWLISQEEGRERAAEHLEREAERDAFVAALALHKNEIPEDKRTQTTALEAARKAAEHDAEIADPVRRYRGLKVRHGIEARELKALSIGYDRAVWRITDELNRRARLVTTSHAPAVRS